MKPQHILLIVLLILVLSKASKKIFNMNFFTEEDGVNALKKIANEVPKDRAKLLERILLGESDHYRSAQYKLTGSAGMQVGKWFGNVPKESITMKDNHTGKDVQFIKWNSVYDFLKYLNAYIDRHYGDWSEWNSKDEATKKQYANFINSISNHTII